MTRALFVAVTCTYPIIGFALLYPSRHELPDFDSFHASHARTYVPGSAEYNMRENIYKRSAEKVREQNAKPNRRWTAGINHMSDQTDEEFASLLGWRHQPGTRSPAKHTSLIEGGKPNDILPDNVSWTHLSMAHALPDQGSCGSCWAMATVTTLSAHSEINFGKPTHFSAQELVDCVQNPLNCGGKGGCDGATVELAMDWAVFKGLESLSAAPTTAGQGTCMKSLFRALKEEQGKLDADGRLMTMVPAKIQTLVEAKSHISIGLAGYTTLPTNQYKPLLKAALTGPVAISVDASAWSSYLGGIFDECGGNKLATINHAVVLFGYGKSSKGMYWLIRNSWGGYWGENGYIKLLRTDDEESTCYTDSDPKMGVSCDGAPSSVKVCGHCGILYDSVVPNFAGGNPTVAYKTDANGGVAPLTPPPPAPAESDTIFSSWTKLR